MSKNPLQSLADFDQSVWYDNIQRSMLTNGELKRLIEHDGLRGMTSNPSIFEKAIAGSRDYEDSLTKILKTGKDLSSKDIFYLLAIEDIQLAADIFHDTYRASKGRDGYVSLEVSPTLAHDAQGTIAEARDLVKRVNRANLMIKVPATIAGLTAIETLTAEGVNINATLLFSVDRYKAVVEAYIKGLEKRRAAGGAISNIASVASFFVSRVDSAVDKALETKIANGGDAARLKNLLYKAAISNAKAAYQAYKDLFNSPRFAALKQHNAQPQRLLWASTGVKNPALSDVLYIEELIGPETVSTIPPATYNAFRDHGKPRASLAENHGEAHRVLEGLALAGIDLKTITDELEAKGVELFADAFTSLLAAIDNKKATSKRASSA